MIWHALLLLPALLVDGAITIFGWFIVPILAALKMHEYRESTAYSDGRRVLSWTPRWAQWWGNEEDGINGLPLKGGVPFRNAEWTNRTLHWSNWRAIVVWAAFRNGASNLRFTSWWGLRISPKHVHKWVVHGTRMWFVSCGWRSNFWYQGRKWRFWIGWPIKPSDRDVWRGQLPKTDARYPGVGFKLQFKRAR